MALLLTTNLRPYTEGTTRMRRPGRNLLQNPGTCVVFRIKTGPLLNPRCDVIPTFAIAPITRIHIHTKRTDLAAIRRAEQVQMTIHHALLPRCRTNRSPDNGGNASRRRSGKTYGGATCRTGTTSYDLHARHIALQT